MFGETGDGFSSGHPNPRTPPESEGLQIVIFLWKMILVYGSELREYDLSIYLMMLIAVLKYIPIPPENSHSVGKNHP